MTRTIAWTSAVRRSSATPTHTHLPREDGIRLNLTRVKGVVLSRRAMCASRLFDKGTLLCHSNPPKSVSGISGISHEVLVASFFAQIGVISFASPAKSALLLALLLKSRQTCTTVCAVGDAAW